MAKARTYNRKVYLINPRFQLRITGYFVVLSIINILIFYSCVFYFFWNMKQKGINVGLPKNHVFFLFINDQQFLMNSIFIVVSILTIVLLIIAGVLISHKVAGPLYRLNNHMRGIASGEKFRAVNFRKGDFFLEIAEAFNLMLNKRNIKD